jgi:hypothetical protein
MEQKISRALNKLHQIFNKRKTLLVPSPTNSITKSSFPMVSSAIAPHPHCCVYRIRPSGSYLVVQITDVPSKKKKKARLNKENSEKDLLLLEN